LKQFVPLLLDGVAVKAEELILDGWCFQYPQQRPSTTELKLSLPLTASFRSEPNLTADDGGRQPWLRSVSLGGRDGWAVGWQSGQWVLAWWNVL